MSINWVMLTAPTTNPNTAPPTAYHPQQQKTPFVLLPSEQILHTSPPRTSLALQTPSTYPGKTPFHLNSPSGTAYLTNRRIVYLPSAPTAALTSFAAPLTHIHDSRVTTPWLGPNVWVAVVQAVAGGGLPAGVAGIEARVTFKEGGAYDFHTKFCMVKERLAQVMEARALSGASDASLGGSGVPAELADDDVHLEQLPAYEEISASTGVEGGGARTAFARVDAGALLGGGRGSGSGTGEPSKLYTSSPPNNPPSPTFRQRAPQTQARASEATSNHTNSTTTTYTAAPTTTTTTTMTAEALALTPAEPPPGYEETQRHSVSEGLERGLRHRAGRTGGGDE